MGGEEEGEERERGREKRGGRVPVEEPESRGVFELDFGEGGRRRGVEERASSLSSSLPLPSPSPLLSSSSSSPLEPSPNLHGGIGGGGGREEKEPLLSKDCVCVYAKDFLFQQALPEWFKDMKAHLPSYLDTEGEEDMLHYPPKR